METCTPLECWEIYCPSRNSTNRSFCTHCCRAALLQLTLLCVPLADIIDRVSLLGSDSGQVLVLVNSSLLCQLTMDSDFDRIILHDCMVLEMSFDAYEDKNLPQRAGLPVSFAFRSPLLFAMTLDGVVCILHYLVTSFT